jgi:hypothetical protein
MKLSKAELESWLSELHPTEFMVCSLIFAGLPHLETVTLDDAVAI